MLSDLEYSGRFVWTAVFMMIFEFVCCRLVISGAWQPLVTIECQCMGENSMNIMPNMSFPFHSGLERYEGE